MNRFLAGMMDLRPALQDNHTCGADRAPVGAQRGPRIRRGASADGLVGDRTRICYAGKTNSPTRNFWERHVLLVLALGCMIFASGLGGCSNVKFTLPRLLPGSGEPSPGNMPAGQAVAATGGQAVKGGPTPPSLSFRVLIEDEDRSRTLEPGEKLSVRVELHNAGAGIAQGVMVELAGTPDFVQRFATPMLVGDVQPEERKQVLLTATLPATVEALPGGSVEVVVFVTEAGGFSPPDHKRFVIPVSPKALRKDAALPPQPEMTPPLPESLEQPDIAAVVIGIETYREAQVGSLPYAQRDAQAVASSLRAHAGVSEANLRLLTNDRAMRSDLEETLDHWVPAKASDKAFVLIYLVGRGVYDPETGEASLIPYEGDGQTREQLYSLARLYRAMSKLSCPVVIFADLSIDEPGVNGRTSHGLLDAIPPDSASNTVLVSATATPRHSIRLTEQAYGAFTASVVKALGGAADRNDDGWVTLEELFVYLDHTAEVDGRVADKHSDGQPVMLPPLGPDHPLNRLPLSKVERSSR